MYLETFFCSSQRKQGVPIWSAVASRYDRAVCASIWTNMPVRFYRATQLRSRGLGSRKLSVCLSVTRVLCDKTKQFTAHILIPHETPITLVFWHLPSEMWPTSLRKTPTLTISAYNVSTVRDCEKSLIMTNRKSTTGYPTSCRWSAYVTPKSSKGGSKAIVFCF